MKLTKADAQRTAVAVVYKENGRIFRFNGTLKEALQTGSQIVYLKTGHIWDTTYYMPILSWSPRWVRETLEMDLPDVGSILWYIEAWPSLGGASPLAEYKYTWDPARIEPGPSSPFPPGTMSHD